MKVNTRFTVALHVLSLIELSTYKKVVSSSENLALSVQTNPAVIRKLLAQLRKANLIETRHGVAGATLIRKPSDITLLDVYNAIKKEDDTFFNMHQDTNQSCYVGENIQDALCPILDSIDNSIEDKLGTFTLEDVIRPIAEKNEIKLIR